MIRPDGQLHEIDVNEWTEEEVLFHLRKTFDAACKDFPDLMEPYATRVADLVDAGEIRVLMRAALRETFTQRWPVRRAKPQAAE